MRMMLKYREVVGLGDTAQELLDFSKRTRALEQLLRNPSLAGMVIVSLDEPVVRAETGRLAAAVQARGVDLIALVWNRVSRPPAPLPATVARRQFFAEETSPPPVGASALRSWSAGWREISLVP
jgi:arsenite-transporting ATPase